MIQLLRHQFSRKRAKLFERGDNELDTEFKDVLDDYAEILCEAQADMLAKNKPKTRMDKHLADVSNQSNALHLLAMNRATSQLMTISSLL